MATAPAFYLELDKTGSASANLVTNESHTLPGVVGTRLILPKYGAFYSQSLSVYSVDPDTQVSTLLTKDTHYVATEMLHKVTKVVGAAVCTVILILPTVTSATLTVSYQALGGPDQVNRDLLLSGIDAITEANADVSWSDVVNKPVGYPPAAHLHDALDLYGLEYVTDALQRIEYAVNTGDEAIHSTLVSEYIAAQNAFFDTYNTDTFEKVDVITVLTKSAEDTLSILSEEVNSIEQSYGLLLPKIADLNKRLLDYKHLNGNDKLANVANLLCNREFEATGTLIDIPALFSDLYLRLDADDYNPTTHTWTSTGSNVTEFTAVVQNAPDYGPSYSVPGKNAVKFTTSKWLNKTSGFNLDIVKGRTVIAVTGALDSSNEIKLPIVSSATKKLEIDTVNEVSAQYSNNDNTQIAYLGKTSRYFEGGAHVNVINIGQRVEDCLCLNNTPYNFYKAPNNIDQQQLSPDDISEDMTYLGHPTLEQNAELLMLLIYQREISKVEMHAILTYIRHKYSANVNYLTNPSFSEGSNNFGSDMSTYLDFTKRDCIKVTDESIAQLDTQNTYSEPGVIDPYDIKLDDGKYLFVFSKNPDVSFWNQEIPLEPNTRYQLKYSLVYGSVNPPDIRLKVDGALHAKTVMLDTTKAIERDIIYAFTTGANPMTKLELFNHSTDTVGNSFGIDDMSLVRMIYAVSNSQFTTQD